MRYGLESYQFWVYRYCQSKCDLVNTGSCGYFKWNLCLPIVTNNSFLFVFGQNKADSFWLVKKFVKFKNWFHKEMRNKLFPKYPTYRVIGLALRHFRRLVWPKFWILGQLIKLVAVLRSGRFFWEKRRKTKTQAIYLIPGTIIFFFKWTEVKYGGSNSYWPIYLLIEDSLMWPQQNTKCDWCKRLTS